MAASEQPLVPGSVVGGRYRLERILGQGGMGVVWAVQEVETGAWFALKLLQDDVEDPDAGRRFTHEARAAQVVRHPHVVCMHGVLELENARPAILMELLEGETLRDVLAREQRLELPELLRVMGPVVAAVGAAHALGVVHRDLKPENLFLARQPSGAPLVKILDFGIAKVTALDGETMRTTGLTTGKVLGTPTYMAPEQVYGQTDLDHRVDIWALGLIFYQALSGVLPTAGDNIGQVFRNVTARPFPPLESLVPDLPPALTSLVTHMLDRDRAARPADLREVLHTLEELSSCEWQPFDAPAPALLAIAARARPELATLAGDREAQDALATAPSSPLSRTSPAPRGAVANTGLLSPGRERRRVRPALIAVAASATIALALLSLRGSSRSTAPSSAAATAPRRPAAAAPLSAAAARLACPIWRAAGAAEPSGWLGAAGAAVACERARVLLGGDPERTLVPAELLELPRGPADSFPADPYGAADARTRSLAAARRRAHAVLDGQVTWSSSGFTVELSLQHPDGEELASATGSGRGLVEAVRAAMTPLVGPSQLPQAATLTPAVAPWARTTDPATSLAAIDLTMAFAHNAGGLGEECQRFAALGARTGELGEEGRWLCAYVLGRPTPEVRLRLEDPSPAGLATHLRLNYLLRRSAPPDAAARLQEIFASEPTPRGRALAAVSASCILGASDPRAARELAIQAVQSEPKNPEGGLCNPWEQLMTLERDSAAAASTLRAMQAWVPWNGYAWLETGFAAGGHAPQDRALLRRAYLLSPLDAQIADTLASAELAAGDRAAARGIALALRSGGLPLHQVASDLLLVRIEASEARFGAALERARRGSQISSSDAGWVRAQRFEIAWRALELAALLGRARPVADELVTRFLAPEPPLLDGHFASVPMRVPAICAHSSAPARCFARFRALRAALPGAITEDTEAFLQGAQLYARRDLAGAARAWQPLLGGRLALASAMPEAMVETFEHTGAEELAERIDDELMQRAGELHGATLAHARSARRALARGDLAKARRLAEQVITAWATADEAPPVLAELRRLVQQAKPPPR